MSSECNQNNTAVPRANENGERWQQARLSVETTYADAPVVLRVNGVRAGTLGNFSASIGKAKSKKSFNVSAMAAAALCGDYVLAYEVVLPAERQTVLYVEYGAEPHRLSEPDETHTQTCRAKSRHRQSPAYIPFAPTVHAGRTHRHH